MNQREGANLPDWTTSWMKPIQEPNGLLTEIPNPIRPRQWTRVKKHPSSPLPLLPSRKMRPIILRQVLPRAHHQISHHISTHHRRQDKTRWSPAIRSRSQIQSSTTSIPSRYPRNRGFEAAKGSQCSHWTALERSIVRDQERKRKTRTRHVKGRSEAYGRLME